MAFAHDTPARTFEQVVEYRLGKGLTPRAARSQLARQFERGSARWQLAIRLLHGFELIVVQPFARDPVKGFGEARIVLGAQTQTRRHRMTTKAHDQARMTRIDQRQRIANMET